MGWEEESPPQAETILFDVISYTFHHQFGWKGTDFWVCRHVGWDVTVFPSLVVGTSIEMG